MSADNKQAFSICVLPGDGIGMDVIDAAIPILEKVCRNADFTLNYQSHKAGAQHYKDSGEALPEATLEAARAADAILFGAMGWPEIRYPDGTEIAPQLDLRFELELYAGVRPARAIPGVKLPLADPRAAKIDLVLIRESTEGLFASRGKGTVNAEDTEARDTMVITRAGSERVHDFAYRLAQRRKAQRGTPGRVTCVDKANVFVSMAYFRKIFDERAKKFSGDRSAPSLRRRHRARSGEEALGIRRDGDREHVRRHPLGPGRGAGRRQWGMAPSADVGDHHGLFQPCHGSAPDIAGQGKANPTAMILSAALMLDWLAERSGKQSMADAAQRIEESGGPGVRVGQAQAVRVRRQRRHPSDCRRGRIEPLNWRPEAQAMSKLRVLGVGAGYFSQFQYLGWQHTPQAECIAIVNRDQVKARALADRFGIGNVYADFDQAVAAEKPDLIDLITPPETHAAYVAKAIAHGIPTICQKPFGTSYADAVAITEAAERANVPLVIHENIRWQPWYREARRLTDDGTLGTLHSVAFRLRPR